MGKLFIFNNLLDDLSKIKKGKKIKIWGGGRGVERGV